MATKIKLLPSYFKKIGLSLIIITILSAAILKVFNFDISLNEGILRTIFCDILIVACCIVFLSRENEEDEMSILIRLREFTITFIMGVSMVLVRNILDIITGENPRTYSATELVLWMCFIHLGFHYMNIWKNKKIK